MNTKNQGKSFKAGGISGEIKADKDKRIIKGYAAIFNVKDSDGDIIEKGAFLETIASDFAPPGSGQPNRVKILAHHRGQDVIGRPTVLREDERGLYFEGKIARTAKGDEILALIDDQVIEEMSFGFNTIDASYGDLDGDRVRYLKKLKLWEISPVTWGANQFTSVEQSKDNQLAFLVKQLQEKGDLSNPAEVEAIHRLLDSRLNELEGLKTLLQGIKSKGQQSTSELFDSLDGFNSFLQDM